ncbi:family 16 glycosylhydrolase [bacterium]|nr:family 16 glycosylhydrolase [bacterium]
MLNVKCFWTGVLIMVAASFCGAAPEPEPEQKGESGPPAHSSWRETFLDDFNVDGLDEEKWESANGPYGHILSSRWRENIEVKDGTLRLIARKETRAGQDWTSGHMWSRSFRQKYGYWECRYRYGAASGLNNAFWMMSGQDVSEDDDYERFHHEIDVNEGHYPNEVAMNLHSWSGKHWSKHRNWYAEGSDLSQEFHVYGMEWTPTELVWYFDGKEIRRLSQDICHRESPVYLSTAVIRWAGEVTDALDGTSMDVDWVRVYERIPAPPTVAEKAIRAKNARFTSVGLEWKQAVDDITPQANIVYRVYRSSQPNIGTVEDAVKHGDLVAEIPGGDSYQVEGLAHSTVNYFNVVAVDGAGDSVAYEMISVKTPVSSDATPPVPGDEGRVRQTARAAKSMTIGWAPGRDNETAESDLLYEVYLSKEIGAALAGNPLVRIKGNTAAVLEDMLSGSTFYVTVVAVDGSGNRAAYQEVEVETALDDSPPRFLLDFENGEIPESDVVENHPMEGIVGRRVQDAERRWVMEFNGETEYLSVQDLDFVGSSATFAAWIKPDGEQAHFAGVVFNRRHVAGLTYGGGPHLVYRWEGGASWDWESGVVPPVGEWSLAAVTVTPEKATLYLYRDGQWQQAEYASEHQEMKVGIMEVGRDSFEEPDGPPRYFKGRMDDVRFYDRALSRLEIEALVK